MTAVPDPYGITAQDITRVERQGAIARENGRSLASCDYYPGTQLHKAFQRGWWQAEARMSRAVD